MLSDHCRRLLTAYVDGELSARQRQAVRRLLGRSPEARALLHQLQQDADALRRLPRQRLDPGFPGRVLQAVHARGLPRRRRWEGPAARPLPSWAGVAVAASVLFLVGVGSFCYFRFTPPEAPGPQVAVRHHRPDVPEGPARPAVVPDEEPPGLPPEERPPQDVRRPEPAPPAGPVAEAPKEKAAPPKESGGTTASAETTLTLPVPEKEMFQPQAVTAVLPSIFKFENLDPAPLREEFKKDTGFRLELPCRESARAFERLQAGFKAHGVGLVIEPVARERLKYPALHTNLVVYAENLLPEELAGILQRAGQEDRRQRDVQFDGLVVTRLSKDDRKELATLLGLDPRAAPPRPAGPLGTDPKKPLSEGTAAQVSQALAGQGGTARAEAKKPAERLAVVLPYNPVRPRPGSAEVKRFLDGRRPARPGAVEVLLVLREPRR